MGRLPPHHGEVAAPFVCPSSPLSANEVLPGIYIPTAFREQLKTSGGESLISFHPRKESDLSPGRKSP